MSRPPSDPPGRRAVERFLGRPLHELYDQGFFEADPDEIRIRLRARDGKVEMVIYALRQGRVEELVLPFGPEEVAAELCG